MFPEVSGSRVNQWARLSMAPDPVAERSIGCVVGCLVGDAAGVGAHWCYDPKKLEQNIATAQTPKAQSWAQCL